MNIGSASPRTCPDQSVGALPPPSQVRLGNLPRAPINRGGFKATIQIPFHFSIEPTFVKFHNIRYTKVGYAHKTYLQLLPLPFDCH
jgi:hypothetical protein